MKRKSASKRNATPPRKAGLDEPHAGILETLSRKPPGKRAPKSDAGAKGGQAERKVCVFVRALKTDRTTTDVAATFIGQVITGRSRFHWGQVPTGFAWVAISPQGNRYFMFHWARMDNHTLPLIEQFCRESGRPCGLLDEDLTCEAGDERFSFFDCTLIHEKDFLARVPRHTKQTGSEKIVETAKRLLARKRGQRETIDEWEFFSDGEAGRDRARGRDRWIVQQVQVFSIEERWLVAAV
jgi:hypothetical protein